MKKRKLLAAKTVRRKSQLRVSNFKVSIDLKSKAGSATFPTKDDKPCRVKEVER